MKKRALLAIALSAGFSQIAMADEAAMVEAGRQLFTHHCTACHTLDPSKNAFGPSLIGIFDRPAASIPRFAYSEALQKSGLTWSEENLRKWVEDNEGLVPDTRMRHVSIKDPAEQDYLISFLKSLK